MEWMLQHYPEMKVDAVEHSYLQLLPDSPHWTKDVKKGFALVGIGKHYTESQVNMLDSALRKKSHNLYCLDTTIFDELYHDQKDWHSLYQLERPHTLEGIAKKIAYCLEQYPQPDDLRIAIASDHGQLMGMSEQMAHCPPGLEPKGRMAIGKTDDPRFVVLDSDRYGLPHDISVVRGSASLAAFSYTTNKKIIGSHGGLFPEEVVVGVSVLRKSVQRHPVLIFCRGEGQPGQPGELEIIIDNPNSVPLTQLCLYIKELPFFNPGKPLDWEISANQRLTFTVQIPEVPELPLTYGGDRLLPCSELTLSGELTFRFAGTEVGSAYLPPGSTIVVNQIFNSGGINIDELGACHFCKSLAKAGK